MLVLQITSKVAAFSLVSYTPSLQDLGSAIIYNIGRNHEFVVFLENIRSHLVSIYSNFVNGQPCSTFHLVVSALKEAKGTSVPVAQYTAEGLPTINLDYKEVSDSEIIQNGSVLRLS